MTLEDDWKELKELSDTELKERKEKEKQLTDAGFTSHISAYPIIYGEL